jgi:hypothetical protein
MKLIALIIPLFLCLPNPALAGTLPKEEISADAKWLVHLEAAQFRATKVGSFVVNQMLENKLSRPVAELNAKFKLDIKVDKILDGIKSITIYGTDYQSPQDQSVLLIRASPELEKVFVGFLAGMVLAGTNAPVQITQTQEGSVSFYAAPGTAYLKFDFPFCAVLPGKVIAIGRSREITEKAAKVLAGKAPNLASSKSFIDFGDTREAFFFLGMAEGFNLGNNLPPQAKLLQAADAGRVVLGEDADQLFLRLALRGKTPDVVTQMEQVVQGLIAIGSLSQPKDQDVAHLLNSIKVSTNGNLVNVGVDYPVERAIAQLKQVHDRMLHREGESTSGEGRSGQETQPQVKAENSSTN